jgi:hypothetical protein
VNSRLLLALALAPACAAQLRPSDIVKLPSRTADLRESYGVLPQQFGELRLPRGLGPHPVVAMIHGGCWAEYADLNFMSNLATRLADDGLAVWNIEYRRVHEEGGGWPGTFRDAGAAIDHLRSLAKRFPLDLKRVVASGHSAGGHLALWAAGRGRIPAASALYVKDPLPIASVVSIAGVPDMEAFLDYGRQVCGDRHIRLFGGTPAEAGARYREGSPHALLPLAASQTLIYGARDRAVPRRLFRDYETAAGHGASKPVVIEVASSDHFEFFAPGGEQFEVMRRALLKAAGL